LKIFNKAMPPDLPTTKAGIEVVVAQRGNRVSRVFCGDIKNRFNFTA
jgi:hypothetical protein